LTHLPRVYDALPRHLNVQNAVNSEAVGRIAAKGR